MAFLVVCCSLKSIDSLYSSTNRRKVVSKELFKLYPCCDREDASIYFFPKYIFQSFCNMATSEE